MDRPDFLTPHGIHSLHCELDQLTILFSKPNLLIALPTIVLFHHGLDISTFNGVHFGSYTGVLHEINLTQKVIESMGTFHAEIWFGQCVIPTKNRRKHRQNEDLSYDKCKILSQNYA